MKGAILDVAPVITYLYEHMWLYGLLVVIIVLIGFGPRIRDKRLTFKIGPTAATFPRLVLTIGLSILIPTLGITGVDHVVEQAANKAVQHTYSAKIVNQRDSTRGTSIVTYKTNTGGYASGILQIFSDDDGRLHVVLCDMQGNPQPYEYQTTTQKE